VKQGRPKLYFLGTFDIYREISRQKMSKLSNTVRNRESAEVIQKQNGQLLGGFENT
jgi:hypothetical protein